MKDEKKMDEKKDMVNFKVYVPSDEKNLINQYISYAKLYEDNQVWKVMKKGLDLIQNEENFVRKKAKIADATEEFIDRVNELEERVATLESTIDKEEEKEPVTMGQKKED